MHPRLAVTIASAAALISLGARAQTVPADAQGGCPISPATVASFFESGTVTLNGVAKPADSTQNLVPNCGFFQWTEQMFLWLTSPAPALYGGGSHVMFSQKFYTVSPEDSSGRRSFIPNSPGSPLIMRLRPTELGPHMLPATLSRTGHVIEERPTPPGRPPLSVRTVTGRMVQLSDVRQTPNGLQFLDAQNRPVQVSKLALPPIKRPIVTLPTGQVARVVPGQAMSQSIIASKIVVHGIPIFIDPEGNVIDVETGQAGTNAVLVSQGGSLIYYITAVNDVLAFHRTMQGAPAIPDTTSIKFPMTMADANAVKTFAATKGNTIVDPEALAIETKSSWIEASAVPNPNDYISVTATIPSFNTSNPDEWVPNGQKTVKLVMVGLHVVGSTNGHGEMVWGTFEHLGNAPDAAYSYTSTSGTKNVPQNSAGSWMFTPSGFGGTPNVQHAAADASNGHIVAEGGGPIAPTAVIRSNPWGVPGSNTGLNTQVISANHSVLSQLNPADVRGKYFQVGTTWTAFGAPPIPASNQVGTNQLANATIETFVQGGSNCFSCHTFNTVATSHVYGALKPLP